MTSSNSRKGEGGIGRRDFGAGVLGTVASLALPGASRAAPRASGTPVADYTLPASSGASPVALQAVSRGAGDEATEAAVARAALAVTNFDWLSRGDTVLIKPVCNSGNVYPATTDPAAIRGMIRLLREQGAGRVLVGDLAGVQAVRFSKDHLSGSTRALMVQNKMAQSIEEAGGELVAFEEAGWDGFHQERVRHGENWSQPLMLPAIVGQVDHIVLMPRCGRHLLAGSTLGLKAAVGWWRHDTRLLYHREGASLPEKTAEANTLPTLLDKQRLVVTSASKVMTTFGPDNGHVLEPELGAVIASPSVVAHDMVSLAWLLESRRITPQAERDGFMKDPYRSTFFMGAINRMICVMLGGIGEGFRGKTPPNPALETIWDDRVLRRAFDVFGGVPEVEFVDSHSRLRAILSDRVARPV